MNTDYEFHLMQLSDSFFPSGMFAMSSGLESLFKHNQIKSASEVFRFIKLQIKYQILPCDCIFLNNTINAAKIRDLVAITNLDKRYYSMKLVKEIRNSSSRSGSQVLNCIIHTTEDSDKMKFIKKIQHKIEAKETPGTYPICLGIASEFFGIPNQSALKMMLYSYSISITGAAIRLGIIEHLEAQKILTDLSSFINIESGNSIKDSIDNVWQLTPLSEILQMNHEQDDSRMFIT